MSTNKQPWQCLGRSFQSGRGQRATGRRVIARYRSGEWAIEVLRYAVRGRGIQDRFAIAARHTRLERLERLDGFRDQYRAVEAMRQRLEFLEGIGRTWLEGPAKERWPRRPGTTRRRVRR